MARQALNERIEDIIAQLDTREMDLTTLMTYAKQADRDDLQQILKAAERHNRRALKRLKELWRKVNQ